MVQISIHRYEWYNASENAFSKLIASDGGKKNLSNIGKNFVEKCSFKGPNLSLQRTQKTAPLSFSLGDYVKIRFEEFEVTGLRGFSLS